MCIDTDLREDPAAVASLAVGVEGGRRGGDDMVDKVGHRVVAVDELELFEAGALSDEGEDIVEAMAAEVIAALEIDRLYPASRLAQRAYDLPVD